MTIKEFFDKQEWTWAKTYADKAPHYYIVRGKANGTDEEYMWAQHFILRHGCPMYFYSRKNYYLYLEGWLYWVMKFDDEDPNIIINRCWAEDYHISNVWKGKKK